jgi:hypothetical protein
MTIHGSGDASRHTIGVALVVAGASSLLLAFRLGPLIVGTFWLRTTLLVRKPSRTTTALGVQVRCRLQAEFT